VQQRKVIEVKHKLSSKERLLLAANHEEPDHVPLCFKWWERPFLADRNDKWHSELERIPRTLKLGLDDTITLKVPMSLSPEVRVRVRKVHRSGEEYPLLIKEYHTPNGSLQRIVRQTSDWPHGDDIPIFTDFVIPRSRSVKYLVEDEDDVEALSCLLCEPSTKELEPFFEEAEQVKHFADEHGVLVEAGMHSEGGVESGVVGADALPWLCGFENVIKAAYTKPKFIDRLLDIILKWDLAYIKLALETGVVDMIVHRGWYENAEFWPPRVYKSFIMPRVQELVKLTHQHGVKFCYIMSMAVMPLLDFFKEIDIDILYGVDPVQGGADLNHVKEEVGEKICIWGGLNSAVALRLWTGKQRKKAVADAIGTLAPGGGFILSAIDQIFEDTPWENVREMIDLWRRIGTYPRHRGY